LEDVSCCECEKRMVSLGAVLRYESRCRRDRGEASGTNGGREMCQGMLRKLD